MEGGHVESRLQSDDHGQPKQPTAHPFLPPRIDDNLYQIGVPDLVTRPKVDKVVLSKQNLTCPSLNSGEEAIISAQQEFLQWARTLHSHFMGEDVSEEYLSEADSLALEYLHQFDNDVQKAVFHLSNLFGCGKDVWVTDHTLIFVERVATNCSFQEFRDRHTKHHGRGMVGAHSQSEEVAKLLSAKKKQLTGTADEESDSLDMNEESEAEALDPVDGAGDRRLSARMASAEKAEARKRWQTLLQNIARVNGGGLRSAPKARYAEALAYLEEAMAQSLPFQVAFSSTGSAAQQSEDLLAIDNARNVLGELMRKLTPCREWVAEVRDTLSRKAIHGIVRDPVKRVDTATLSDLQSLLSQTRSLELAVVDEEKQLCTVVDGIAAVSDRLRALLPRLSVSPLFVLPANLSPRTHPARTHPFGHLYTPEEVERLLFVALSGQGLLTGDWKKLPLEDGVVAFADTLSFLQGERDSERERDSELVDTTSSTSVESVDKGFSSVRANSSKVRLSEFDELLSQCRSLSPSLSLTEADYLAQISVCAHTLNDKAQAVADAFALSLSPSARGGGATAAAAKRGTLLVPPPGSRGTLSWERVCLVCRAVSRYPVSLPAFDSLSAAVKRVEEWRNEVHRLVSTSSSNNQPNGANGMNKRTSGTTSRTSSTVKQGGAGTNPIGSSKGGIPLKKIDSLLSEGERLPVLFPAELALLRDQREQARALIKRLRESLELTRRKNNRLEREGETGSKMDYNEFKLLVEGGESLYREGEREGDDGERERESAGPRAVQKDLDRAQTVMEIAESWLSNVRELIRSHIAVETATAAKLGGKKVEREGEAVMEIEGETAGGETAESEEDAEEELVRKREVLAQSLRDQLDTVTALPFVMEEAEVVRYQLQALEWASKNRDMLLFHTQSRSKRSKPRYAEIEKMREEIMRIRTVISSWGSLGAEGEEESEDGGLFMEETLCYEISRRASDFHDKLRKCLQGKEVKTGTALDRLQALLAEADDIPVNFENELRPVRLAVSATETWISTHAAQLHSVGIVQRETERVTERESSETDSLSPTVPPALTMDALTQLIDSASELPTTFPALSALQQKVSEGQTWLQAVKALKEKTLTFVRVLSKTRTSSFSTLEEVRSRLQSLAVLRRDATSLSTEEVLSETAALSGYDIASLKDLAERGRAMQFDFTDDLDFIALVMTLLTDWSTGYRGFIDGEMNRELSAADRVFRHCLRVQPALMGIPFLETLTFSLSPSASESVSASPSLGSDAKALLGELLLKKQALTELEGQITLLDQECRAFASPQGEDSMRVQLHRETLSLIAAAQHIVVHGSDRDRLKREREAGVAGGEPLLRHWGDVDTDLVSSLIRRLQLVYDKFAVEERETAGETEAVCEGERERDEDDAEVDIDRDSNLLSSTVLAKCLQRETASPSPGIAVSLSSPEPAAKRVRRGRERDAEREGERDEEEEDAVEGEGVATRGSQGVVVRRKRALYTDEVEVPRGAGETVEEERETKGRGSTGGKRRRGGASTETQSGGPIAIPVSVSSQKRDEFSKFVNRVSRAFGASTVYSSSLSLSLGLSLSLDYWLQLLTAFQARLSQVRDWKARLQSLLPLPSSTSTTTSSTAPVKAGVGEAVRALLREAVDKGVRSDDRTRLEEVLVQADQWLSRAKAMLARERGTLMKVDDVREFVRSAEKDRIRALVASSEGDELSRLKREIKRATEWRALFDQYSLAQQAAQSGTPVDPSTPSVEDLTVRASSICVDLSEEVDSLTQSHSLYCLCRQIYFGHMVGCDLCDDWYHLTCVGLTQAQADKQERYSCVRCALRQSVAVTASLAAETTNKWALIEEHFRQRDLVIGKYTRRIVRDQGELEKLRKLFIAQTNGASSSSIPVPVPTPSTPPTVVSANTTEVEGLPVPASVTAVPATLATLTQQIAELTHTLDRQKAEHQRLQSVRALELSRQLEIRKWMRCVQSLLWPGDSEDLVRKGDVMQSPDLLPLSLANDYLSLITGINNRLSKSNPNGLFSEGAKELRELAMSMKIADIDDIQHVLEQFQWMHWCTLALQVLRVPACTPILRRLCDKARTLRSAEENKIVKTLSAICAKASAWKHKARRVKLTHKVTNKRTEEGKLRALVLEANNLPFCSRLKTHYSHALDVFAAELAALEKQGVAVGEREKDDAKADKAERRKSKGEREKDKAVKGKGFTADSAQGLLSQSMPYSSDEEGESPREREGDTMEVEGERDSDGEGEREAVRVTVSGTERVRDREYWQQCYSEDVQSRVAPVIQCWPPQITVTRKPIAIERERE